MNGSGSVLERYAYDPYGTVVVLSAAWGSLSGSNYAWIYLHQGGRWDGTTGLYDFRHRAESPALARWTKVDPLGFSAGDTNLYRNVGNNPILYTDPSGEIIILLIVGGAIAGWYLLGPGAGTANAPDVGQEAYIPPPRPLGEDAAAGLPGAMAGAAAGLIAGLGGFAAGETSAEGGTAAGGTAAGGTASGTVGGITAAQQALYSQILRGFFTRGILLLKTPENIAALLWYLQVAREKLAEYAQMGYTGPGVATQQQRIQQILQQLSEWGIQG